MNPSYNNSFGQQGAISSGQIGGQPAAAPQMPISSGGGDIVLQPEKKSKKGGLFVGLALALVAIVLVAVCVYFFVSSSAKGFKSKISNFLGGYSAMVDVYSTAVNVNTKYVDWDRIAKDYAENGAKYEEAVADGVGLEKDDPMSLDGQIVERAKSVVSKTSKIGDEMVTNMRFLSDVYNGYVSYWLPFKEKDSYSGDLPGFDYSIVGWEDDDAFQAELRHFGNFMEEYKGVMRTLRYNYIALECADEDTEECEAVENSIASHENALQAEWDILQDTIFEQLQIVDDFSEGDKYGIEEIKKIEKEINEK